MTIYPMSATTLALYISPQALQKRGITSPDIDQFQAQLLTQEAMVQAEISVEGRLEIQAYPEPCGVLIFAHITPACLST